MVIDNKVTILKPIGYCTGVINAINVAFSAKKDNPNKNIYVIGMLVHNEQIINMLLNKGINLIKDYNDIESLEKIEKGSVIIFTAHGHIKKLEKLFNSKDFIVYDAICAKVLKNLTYIQDYLSKNKEIIYIGQAGHPEAEAALCLSKDVLFYDINKDFNFDLVKTSDPLVINQTTLNYQKLSHIFSKIRTKISNPKIMDEVCSATRIRQENIINLSDEYDSIIVIGDKKSSNTNKLYELAVSSHPQANVQFVQTKKDLDLQCLKAANKIAITSGTSASPETIEDVYNAIISL